MEGQERSTHLSRQDGEARSGQVGWREWQTELEEPGRRGRSVDWFPLACAFGDDVTFTRMLSSRAWINHSLPPQLVGHTRWWIFSLCFCQVSTQRIRGWGPQGAIAARGRNEGLWRPKEGTWGRWPRRVQPGVRTLQAGMDDGSNTQRKVNMPLLGRREQFALHSSITFMSFQV